MIRKLMLTALVFTQGLLLFGLPVSVDNSKSKYFPPIISQSGGSCAQASIIGYTFTYEMNRFLDVSASEAKNRYSYFYTWNFLNEGKDQGGFSEDGLSIATSNGVMNEEDFPPQSSWYEFRWESGYDKYLRAMRHRAQWYMYIDVTTAKGIEEAKTYLAEGGVVGFGAHSTGWTIEDYDGPSETGYDKIMTKTGTDGAHALTIAGYDDSVEYKDSKSGETYSGAFVVVNTWGKFSHSDGRFYLPYHLFTTPHKKEDLDTDVLGFDVTYTEPQIVFRVKVDYTSRDDLSFMYGFNDNWRDTIPKNLYKVAIADHQGGDHCMCGGLQVSSSKIDMGFDFSRYVNKMAGIENPNFFICIDRYKRGNVEGSGKFLGFWVYDYREDRNNPKIYSCTEGVGRTLHKGSNYFSLMRYLWTSRSPVVWLFNQQPVAAPLVFKTADGKYAKVRFSDYNREDGTIRVKYVYSPSGDRNVK